ncbi:MAG: ChbG/HpnK family deacetylase [Cytophagaceae bacterium]|nr:ChbG/HpnK family deacetylase [Cytophagaceae bacterium]
MRKLIVNADDYGLSNSVNKAILNLLESERISSTTVLANYASSHALQQLLPFKNQAGIHLNLVEGKPICDPDLLPSITENGCFIGSKKMLKRLILHRINPAEVAMEVRAQIIKVKEAGFPITHADSHQHTHTFPLLSSIIAEELSRFSIQYIRYSKPDNRDSARMKMLFGLQLFFSSTQKKFKRPSALLSDFSIPNFNPQLLEKKLKKYPGVVELMCHPSVENDRSYLNKKRDYEFLQSDDWLNILKTSNRSLIPFNF